MPEIKNLTDKNGNVIYPKTSSDAVLINEQNLSDYIEKINTLEDTTKNIFTGINPEKRDPYRFARRTKGSFNNASIVSINNDNAPAEVMGIRNDEQLASYADRDGVGVYIQYQMPERSLLTAVNFTETTVQVSQDIKETIGEIEIGDFIDVMRTGTFEVGFYQADKYSGKVTNIDYQNKTIYVGGWYQIGNTSSGQIPSIDSEYINIIVNPITKGWCINANMMLSQNAHGWGGVIGEYGLFNSKSSLDNNYKLGGHDVVNFGGRAEFGYLVRGSKGYPDNLPTTDVAYKALDDTITTGFLAEGTRNGFIANNNAECAFKTANNKFFIRTDGAQQTHALSYKVHSNPDNQINLSLAPIHIITESGEYNLTAPEDGMYELVRIYSLKNDNEVKINGNFSTSYGGTTQIQMQKQKVIELFSDGNIWYTLNY